MSAEWVIAKVSVSKGDVDWVGVEATFDSQEAADAALAAGDYPEKGHPWSGMTVFRVLEKRGEEYLNTYGNRYHPSDGYGF